MMIDAHECFVTLTSVIIISRLKAARDKGGVSLKKRSRYYYYFFFSFVLFLAKNNNSRFAFSRIYIVR